MGKWIAGILGSVIAGLIFWQLTNPPEAPRLRVTSWATPETVELGTTMDITVKVLDQDDNPVPDAHVQLTPTSGSFLWAAAGTDPITGASDENGLYTTTFQTVMIVGVIGDPLPANSGKGTISILVRKDGYQDSRADLEVRAR
jgi:hypothetical protein